MAKTQKELAKELAEARIQQNRERKARRFVDHFIEQMRAKGVLNPLADKAALEVAVAVARDASKEQWAQLAEHLTCDQKARGIDKVEDPPSPATVVLIVADLQRKIAAVDYQKKQDEEDAELFAELLRQRKDPELLDAREAAVAR